MTNTTPKSDPVNHPSHYTQYPVEVIELTRHMSFTRGNAVKYIARAGFKGGQDKSPVDLKKKELEDLKKARWYVDDDIKQLELQLEKLVSETPKTTYFIPNASVQTLEFTPTAEASDLLFGKAAEEKFNDTVSVKITAKAKG